MNFEKKLILDESKSKLKSATKYSFADGSFGVTVGSVAGQALSSSAGSASLVKSVAARELMGVRKSSGYSRFVAQNKVSAQYAEKASAGSALKMDDSFQPTREGLERAVERSEVAREERKRKGARITWSRR